MKKYLLTAFCFSVLTTNAQIYYQDVSPDVVLSSWNAHNIQIDSPANAGLSTAQAVLVIWEDFNTQTDLNAFGNCEVMISSAYPAALNAGQTIKSSATWQAPNYSILYDGTNGNWQNKTDKYVGVRIKEGGLWYYGWIRLDVNNSGNSVTIKDYACNMTAGDSILAGQTSATTGISTPQLEKVNLALIGKTLVFTGLTSRDNIEVIIYSLDGRTVQRTDATDNRIQLDNVSKGMYVVALLSGNNRKIFRIGL